VNKKEKLTFSSGIFLLILGIEVLVYKQNLMYSGISAILLLSGCIMIAFVWETKNKTKISKDKIEREEFLRLLNEINKNSNNAILINQLELLGDSNHETRTIIQNITNDLLHSINEIKVQIINHILTISDKVTDINSTLKMSFQEEKQVLDKIEKNSQPTILIKHTETIIEKIELIIDVNQKAIGKYNSDILLFSSMPEVIIRSIDELMELVNENNEAGRKAYENVLEDVQFSYKTLVDRIKKDMSEVLDSLNDYESKVTITMQELIKQYQGFQKYNDGVVKQLTLMSQSDLDIMRGILHGE